MIPPCLGCISLIQDSPRSLSHADPERGDNLLRLERNSLVLQPAFQISWFLGMLYRRLSTAPVVTIAKVAGRVRGAGNEFILACDMCSASHERAVFGQMEAGLGLLPGAGGVQHLTRLVGRQRAMEVVLSGDDYGAELAAQYGWINRAIADATLDTFVGDLARRIAKFPASACEPSKPALPIFRFRANTRFGLTRNWLAARVDANAASRARVYRVPAAGCRNGGEGHRGLLRRRRVDGKPGPLARSRPYRGAIMNFGRAPSGRAAST
jgi:enoyl-CoA hydratase/carnithine racemase